MIRIRRMSPNQKIVIDLTNNRTFFLFLLLGVISVFVNLIINFWIIREMKINSSGFNEGKISILKKGIALGAKAQVQKKLSVQKIVNTNENDGLHFSAKNQIHLKSQENHIGLDKDKLEMQANQFEFVELDQEMKSARRKILISQNTLTTQNVDGLFHNEVGGIKVIDSVNTPKAFGRFDQDLRVESLMKNIEMRAKNDLHLASKYEGIKINSFEDIKINAQDQLKILAEKTSISNLPSQSDTLTSVKTSAKAAQLCTCENGIVYLSNENSSCTNSKICEGKSP